jgi:DNA-binding NtrC family response regulator
MEPAMKILLIDDDKFYVEPLLWELNEQKFNVIYCKSIDNILGENGKLKEEQPDCILLDIMMPRGDMYSKKETDAGKDTGLRLLADIYKERPNVPVIIITVRGNINGAEMQKKFGSLKKVLVKPVTPTEVVKAINELNMETR